MSGIRATTSTGSGPDRPSMTSWTPEHQPAWTSALDANYRVWPTRSGSPRAIRRSARMSARCRSRRQPSRFGHSARHAQATRQRSLILPTVRRGRLLSRLSEGDSQSWTPVTNTIETRTGTSRAGTRVSRPWRSDRRTGKRFAKDSADDARFGRRGGRRLRRTAAGLLNRLATRTHPLKEPNHYAFCWLSQSGWCLALGCLWCHCPRLFGYPSSN